MIGHLEELDKDEYCKRLDEAKECFRKDWGNDPAGQAWEHRYYNLCIGLDRNRHLFVNGTKESRINHIRQVIAIGHDLDRLNVLAVVL